MLSKLFYLGLLFSFSILVLGSASEKSQDPSKIGLFKYHQNGYYVKSHRMEVISYNKDYFARVDAEFYPYNRTIRALNVTVTTKVNISALKIHIQAYKFMSNEYRYFPVTIEFDFCRAMKDDYFDLMTFANNGNMHICNPFKAETAYYSYNWIPDISKYPPLLPRGDYKMDLIFTHEQTSAFFLAWYGAVIDKVLG